MWTWLTGLHGGALTVVGSAATFVFGLIALSLGALLNSHLNRLRDQRLLAQDTKSTAAALYGEILMLRKEIAHTANFVAKAYFDEGFSPQPSVRFDKYLLERTVLPTATLYLALAGKIGLLEPEIVLAIVKFHADYQAVRHWLPRLLHDEDRGFSYSVLHLLEPARDAVIGVNPALRKVEAQLAIHEAEEPPMKAALQALDFERDSWTGLAD